MFEPADWSLMAPETSLYQSDYTISLDIFSFAKLRELKTVPDLPEETINLGNFSSLAWAGI